MTDIRDTMLALQSLQGAPTDTLRTNAFASAARKVMAPLVLPFLRRHPQIPIDLVTEGKLVDIVAWGFDLGLRPTDPVPSDMIGPRLVDHVPFGHGNTQTFIAALRHDRLDAPWVINGVMNRELFALYVETQLDPTLRPGDVIILDKLSPHKSPKGSGEHERRWRVVLVPASLQPRPEPDRDHSSVHADPWRSRPHIREAQGPDPESRRANPKGSLARCRAGPQSFHRWGMLQFLQSRRI